MQEREMDKEPNFDATNEVEGSPGEKSPSQSENDGIQVRNRKARTTLIVFILVCLLAYLVYDRYYQLPFNEIPVQQEDETDSFLNSEGFTVLVLGLDGRLDINDRTDTILLATLNGRTKEARMLSIPRDTRVQIEGSWNKINAAYVYGGVELTRATVEELLGLEIARHVIVNFESLIHITDEIGGIELNVPMRMYVPLEGIDLYPGWQHLDGEDVLAYARFRDTPEGDIGRAKRQQEVVTLLAEKLFTLQNIPRLTQLIPIFNEYIETDLTVKEMISLARIAPDMLEKEIKSEVLPGKNKKIDGIWFWEADLQAYREE